MILLALNHIVLQLVSVCCIQQIYNLVYTIKVGERKDNFLGFLIYFKKYTE